MLLSKAVVNAYLKIRVVYELNRELHVSKALAELCSLDPKSAYHRTKVSDKFMRLHISKHNEPEIILAEI